LIRGLFSSFRRRTPRLIGAGSRRWSRRSRIILMKSAVRSIGRRRARHSEASASLVAGTLSAFQETWQSRLRKNRETCEFIRQPKSQLGKQKNQGILENVLPPCAGTSTPAAAADSPSDRGPAGIDGAIDSFVGRSTFVGDARLCAFRRCFTHSTLPALEDRRRGPESQDT
jgi:hypothetical protein